MSQKRQTTMMRSLTTGRLFLALALVSAWSVCSLLAEPASLDAQPGTSEALFEALRAARVSPPAEETSQTEESRLRRSRDVFTKLQISIQAELRAGTITHEEAATRLVGAFSELGFLVEDAGQYGAAIEIFRGALSLVEGTLQEIEMLKNVARCAEWSDDPATARLAYRAIAQHPLFLQVEDGMLAAHEYVVWKLMADEEGGAESAVAARTGLSRLVDRILESGDSELLASARDRLNTYSWDDHSWLEPLARSLRDGQSELARAGGGVEASMKAAGVESRQAAADDLIPRLGANLAALLAHGDTGGK
jgi:hypothetical protein